MLDREFFLGFIRIHILSHAAQEAIFGVEIAEELARHGYSISPGTLYPLLHRLEKEGYLESSSKVVNGRVRKYYQATTEGKLVLEQSKEKECFLKSSQGQGQPRPPYFLLLLNIKPPRPSRITVAGSGTGISRNACSSPSTMPNPAI